MEVGQEVKVSAGPYNGLVGVVQRTIEGNVVLGYMDKGRPRTITVAQSQVVQMHTHSYVGPDRICECGLQDVS